MKRRDFLKAGGGASLVGAWGAASVGPTAQAAADDGAAPIAPAVLGAYTAEDHRQRLQNIARCEQGIRTSMRKHLVTSYLPGQACYNLGEYPCRKPWNPDEYDEQELDRLRDHGIQLIHVFDEWNDAVGLFGGDKYTALNPDGFRRFVEMVHQRGMKVLAYVSTGFLDVPNSDFQPHWSRKDDTLHVGYFNLARCSPSSAGWRAYVLPRIMGVLDENNVDGIYIDCGYVTNSYNKPPPTEDEVVLAFEETPTHDGALADMLALIYAEVKRRSGIVKLHISGAARPRVGDLKVYDYLWVGEGVNNADGLREKVKNHLPYVVPCIDREFAAVANEEEDYLHSVPYMQFPILHAGRPFTGERALIPGIKYPSAEKDFWVRRCREIWEQYQANPDGPYTYSIWDSVPGNAKIRPAHARWLKQYLPMVEEGTWAWLEIGESDFFSEAIPSNVVASAFANRQLHLVVANYGKDAVKFQTTDAYVPADDPGATATKDWTLGGRSLRILHRSV
ncbi:MAG: hypothetical protein GXP26_13045 [Planctomycetes bacterium]|nr:hypothetical protein [Planctomycetota bacterium]